MAGSSRRWVLSPLVLFAAVAAAGCGSGFNSSGGNGAPQRDTGPAALTVLIGSSGAAETKAVTDAAQAWAKRSGNTVTVTPAQDIKQQLGQGWAAGSPPDLFYVDAAVFADYASVGALEPYADALPDKDDFYPHLRRSFTYRGRLYCIPKDFSTLALQINTTLWKQAGLTDADTPTTWDQLRTVAQRLTTPNRAGLALGDTRDRIGAFLVQSGGWITDPDATRATADSPQNLQALEYVRSLLASGAARFPKQLDSGWPGEAFGKQRAAMTIEGNWIRGALRNDYPDVAYTVVPLPAGPKGPGTLSFTNCWGIAAKSAHKAAAVDLARTLSTKDTELGFAKAFGVMPARRSARAAYTAAYPQDKAFIDGADHAQGPVNAPKMNQVLTDFDTALQGLPAADPHAILARLQTNAAAVLGK